MLLYLGAGAVVVGLIVAVLVAANPGRDRLPRERRRPTAQEGEGEGALAGAAEAATTVVGHLLRRRGGGLEAKLNLAGLTVRAQDFVFLIGVASLALAAVTLLLGGGLLTLPIATLAPIAAVLFLNIRVASRQKAFSRQLDSTLQLMSSGLRAGHSMMQALSGVARDSEEPTASELARVVNETRVGRPVVPALEEVAERMESEDFRWAAQAIAINREVGGSLAEVLDGVAGTIRERGQIRRHVAALSAEGRLSALILMLLPFGIGGFLLLTNPGYLAPLIENPIGWVLLGVGAVMLLIGGLWLRKTVEVKF